MGAGKREARDKEVLTTGDVARLCRVTIRTVIKWYEQERLEGYRLPGSRDRRFTRVAVERFMRSNEIPLDLLSPKQTGAPCVLVVDDDDGVRRMVCRFLETLGVLQVESAATGWEAGLKTATLRPAVLLLDYRLGDTTGEQVLLAIRAMPDLKQPGILIMSAHLTPEDGERLLAAGADAVLAKPFDLPLLRDLVYQYAGIAGSNTPNDNHGGGATRQAGSAS
jgi:excisionase family DNA binding protein